MGETGQTRWPFDSVVLLILRKTGVNLDICQSLCRTRCPLSPWSQWRQSEAFGVIHPALFVLLIHDLFVYWIKANLTGAMPSTDRGVHDYFIGMKARKKTKKHVFISHSSNTQTQSSVCNVANKKGSNAFSRSLTNTIGRWPASEEQHDYGKTCDHIQIWGMMEHEVGLLSSYASVVSGEITAVCWGKCCNLLRLILWGLWREEARAVSAILTRFFLSGTRSCWFCVTQKSSAGPSCRAHSLPESRDVVLPLTKQKRLPNVGREAINEADGGI